eukprot:4012714-Amphidinium_carterae.2
MATKHPTRHQGAVNQKLGLFPFSQVWGVPAVEMGIWDYTWMDFAQDALSTPEQATCHDVSYLAAHKLLCPMLVKKLLASFIVLMHFVVSLPTVGEKCGCSSWLHQRTHSQAKQRTGEVHISCASLSDHGTAGFQCPLFCRAPYPHCQKTESPKYKKNKTRHGCVKENPE